MLLSWAKGNQNGKSGIRLLVSVTVVGSAGPLRFLVNEDDLIASVLCTALKSYAREGRFPVLGLDLDNCLLYCPHAGSKALSPGETIGSVGARNFMLCKKQQGNITHYDDEQEDKLNGKAVGTNNSISRRGSSGRLKSWVNKSLNLKISSH